MTAIRDWGEAFLTAISQAFSKFFGFLPDLIGALLILCIGWFIAGFLSKLVANLLRKVRFNEAAEKAGLSRFIQTAGVKQDASGLMGEIVKWFFRIIALVAAFSVLQLPALTAALTGILNFIPNLFIALVIILIGGLLANFVGDFVKGAATSAGFGNANMVSNIARYAILYVAVIAALGQIGIAETVINTIFIGTVAALALALGLSFGLGGRDTASRIWDSAYSSAQENLPKLGQGMKQQAQTQKQQLKQGLQQASQNNPRPRPTPEYNPGYAAGSQQSQPSSGGYSAPPPSNPGIYNNPNPQPGGYYGDSGSNQPQSGGYYGGSSNQPQQGSSNYYGNSQPRPDSTNRQPYPDNGELYDPDNTNYPRS